MNLKKINYEQELNSEQIKAVQTIHGPLLVIAGAGSGKTKTLVFRLAYLIESGVMPSNILLLTFTRKASQEMMNRAKNLLDNRCMEVTGGTFHSIANYLLRKHSSLIGYPSNFTILDQGDSEDIINLIRAELNLAENKKTFPQKRTLFQIFSKSVNTGRKIQDILIDEYPKFIKEEDRILLINQKYKEYKRKNGLMDYDDLLIELKNLLQKNETIRKNLSLHYQYIMVDEYQDTNKLQAHIACLLASQHGNIMVVGDDSQSIYSFRGATFRNIMDFPKIFKNTTIITLEQNYRSTQPILDFTNKIIERAKEKYCKNLFSEIQGYFKPQFFRPKDGIEQARFVCERILHLWEKQKKFRDIAVLFRAGWHSNELEIELGKHQIPYVKYGGLKFAETAHIKDALSFLRVAFNPSDAVAWLRLFLLLEGIGPKTAQKIIHEIVDEKKGIEYLYQISSSKKSYSNSLADLYKLLNQVQTFMKLPQKAIDKILRFYTPVMEQKYDDSIRRLPDLDSLELMSAQYESIEDFLSTFMLDPPDFKANSEEEPEDQLVLSTIHSAKGLEWDTVFVIDLLDGRFPSSQSLKNPDELEEERRLFYVACTRAKKQLFMISPIFRPSFSSYADFATPFSGYSSLIQEILNFDSLTEKAMWLDSCPETEDPANYQRSIDDYFDL